MCAPFAADFDGDEMTVLPLKRSQSLDECNTFEWDYSRLSNERIHSELLSSRHPRQEKGFFAMNVRSTLCWSDTKNSRLKITKAHTMCGVTVLSFIKFSKPHKML
jgi:hypothetical protein